MTFCGLFTVWEGQSGPGRADGNHTTVTSEGNCSVMHLYLQKCITNAFSKYELLIIAPLLCLDTFYEAKCHGRHVGRCKEECRIQD